jgi:hypothetical protein
VFPVRTAGFVGTAAPTRRPPVVTSSSSLAAVGPSAADARQMHRMNETLLRLQATIETRLEECRRGGEDAAELTHRAERLTERLDILKRKLRVCFQVSGEEAAPNLQVVLQQLADVDPDDAPEEFVCPISQCLMVDPVFTVDGQVYDRGAIQEWFATFTGGRQCTSPLTNLPLRNSELKAHVELRDRIQRFMEQARQAQFGPRKKGEKGGKAAAAGPEEPSVRLVPASLRLSGRPDTVADDVDLALLRAESGVEEAPAPERRSGPIWSSSVVPAGEEDSRLLNLLRVHEGIAIPASSAAAPPPAALEMPAMVGGGFNAVRHRARVAALRTAQPPPGTAAVVAPRVGARSSSAAIAPTTDGASRHIRASVPVTAARRVASGESSPMNAPPRPSAAGLYTFHDTPGSTAAAAARFPGRGRPLLVANVPADPVVVSSQAHRPAGMQRRASSSSSNLNSRQHRR